MKPAIRFILPILFSLAMICLVGMPHIATAQKVNKVPVVLTLAKGNQLLGISASQKGSPLKANQTRAFLLKEGGKLKIEFPGWINDTLLYVVAPRAITLDMGLKNSLGLTKNESIELKAGKINLKSNAATILPTNVALKED
jgi:hypothetical protein